MWTAHHTDVFILHQILLISQSISLATQLSYGFWLDKYTLAEMIELYNAATTSTPISLTKYLRILNRVHIRFRDSQFKAIDFPLWLESIHFNSRDKEICDRQTSIIKQILIFQSHSAIASTTKYYTMCDGEQWQTISCIAQHQFQDIHIQKRRVNLRFFTALASHERRNRNGNGKSMNCTMYGNMCKELFRWRR